MEEHVVPNSYISMHGEVSVRGAAQKTLRATVTMLDKRASHKRLAVLGPFDFNSPCSRLQYSLATKRRLIHVSFHLQSRAGLPDCCCHLIRSVHSMRSAKDDRNYCVQVGNMSILM